MDLHTEECEEGEHYQMRCIGPVEEASACCHRRGDNTSSISVGSAGDADAAQHGQNQEALPLPAAGLFAFGSGASAGDVVGEPVDAPSSGVRAPEDVEADPEEEGVPWFRAWIAAARAGLKGGAPCGRRLVFTVAFTEFLEDADPGGVGGICPELLSG